VGGKYDKTGRAFGGWAERVEDPEQVAPALQRLTKVTENAKLRYWNSRMGG
jgi:thiamine pyrophosphate-dependent acetolactate synthase large subunit-like protein